jgi:Fe-S cluster assembly protein SufD
LRERLARQADYDTNPFTALNTAFLENGAYLRIPKDVHVDAPIHLLFSLIQTVMMRRKRLSRAS